MRNLYKILPTIVVLNILLFSSFLHAQTSILEKFSGETISGKVLLSWTVKSGQTCNGIRIYRSEDSLTYIEIGDIQGVCGNLGFSVDYTFEDNDPFKNQVNYYRLDLGGVELTHSIAVEVIEVGQNDYYLKANPLVEQTKLYFRNSTEQTRYLTIVNLNGQIIDQKETIADYFILNASDYENGLFYFTISTRKLEVNSDQSVKGKFMVVAD